MRIKALKEWFKDLFYIVKHYKIHKLVIYTNIDDLNKRINWLETQLSHINNAKQDKE